MADGIRDRLVGIALEWQRRFGVAPSITSAISEFDAVGLVNMTLSEYESQCVPRTAVTRGCDFVYQGCRYQIKGSRPSGKPGSKVLLVARAGNFDWHRLIWILYDTAYNMQEAWEWDVQEYRSRFESKKLLLVSGMRQGRRIFPT